MSRRDVLRAGAALLPCSLTSSFAASNPQGRDAKDASLRPQPSRSAPTSPIRWDDLAAEVEGRLKPVQWPLADCIRQPRGIECEKFFQRSRNPYYLGDHPGLTQSFGWVDAWTAKPSNHVLEALSAEDVAAAVDFARKHGVRIVVKGGGHSYQGGSNAEGSLLVWTRRMRSIILHDAFVPLGSTSKPLAAVSIGAGAMWGEVYQEVCVRAGRYVQGGGCLTVGVAGLVQSGGFGSFSKTFGLAAAGLLEAEVITADGAIRSVNERRDPDLFFALKGGGGGTFGIVTRLTLRTHDLPDTFGAVIASISSNSDESFRNLVREILSFYAEALFNPHWGEQIVFRPNNVLALSMLFQGLRQEQAERVWAPFLGWVRARPRDYRFGSEPVIMTVPARSFWNPDFLRTLPGIVLPDDQPGAPQDRVFWAGNREESGQYIHAFQSAWLPADLLAGGQPRALGDALFAASRHWSIALHTNKGLAGAPAAAREAAETTAMNPAVIDAFALAIVGAEGPPAYPGVAGHEPDVARARRDAERVAAAMKALKSRVLTTGSYLAESDFFESDWQQAYWGNHYGRLQGVKRQYDPEALFSVHHGATSA